MGAVRNGFWNVRNSRPNNSYQSVHSLGFWGLEPWFRERYGFGTAGSEIKGKSEGPSTQIGTVLGPKIHALNGFLYLETICVLGPIGQVLS